MQLESMTTGQLIARVRELEAALTPFAKAAEAFPKPKLIVVEAKSKRWPNYYLTSDDLHRAREHFSKQVVDEVPK